MIDKKMRLSNTLKVNNIFIYDSAPSKQQVIGQLIGSLDLPDPTLALKAIIDREEIGSTIIAPGVSFPHARIPAIKQISAALGICSAGIHDPKNSKAQPIHFYFLFVSPSENIQDHLAFLATASALFQKEKFVKQLLSLKEPSLVMDAIRKLEKGPKA